MEANYVVTPFALANKQYLARLPPIERGLPLFAPFVIQPLIVRRLACPFRLALEVMVPNRHLVMD